MVEIKSYGPWAVITGASSGIGKAFADQLAAAGLNLVLAARSTGKLDALGQALAGTHGIGYRAVTVDLSDPAGPRPSSPRPTTSTSACWSPMPDLPAPARCWTSRWTTCT